MDSQKEPTNKSCRLCALSIPKAATLCSHCDSYQNWRGLIGVNATVLSMLTALIATSISALPVIHSALHKPNSEIYTGGLFIRNNKFFLQVMNSGDRAGIVYNLQLWAGKDSDSVAFFRPDDQYVLIKSGEAKEIPYTLEFSTEKLRMLGLKAFKANSSENCDAGVWTKDFLGRDSVYKFKIRCEMLMALPFRSSGS